jgi:tRNA A-37 threonylcarbamoyl transferase component Bud32
VADVETSGASVIEPGTVLEDRYRVLDVLGEGGIGIVYAAEHIRLKQRVAIKILKSSLVTHPSLRPRFEREGLALAALSHPNIVAVRDFGVADGYPYIAMELLEGRTLRSVMDERRLPLDRVMVIARELLRGLAHAHSENIAHRDLKPGNVLLCPVPRGPDHVKLFDFGFAQLLAAQGQANLSLADEAFGTPAYMAPEQLTGGTTGPRTDVYAFGVLFFELLTGQKPFEGSLSEMVRAHLTAPVPRLWDKAPELAARADLQAIVDRCLAKSPDLRFPNAKELLAAVERAVKNEARAIKRRNESSEISVVIQPRKGNTLVGVVAFALAIVALGVFASVGGDSGEHLAAPPVATVADVDPPEAPVEPLEVRVERYLRGEAIFDENDMAELNARVRSDRRNPESHLMLARVFLMRGWRTDAIERYLLAWELAPDRVRGDESIQADLLDLAADDAVWLRASIAIERIWGADALPDVEARLAHTELTEPQRTRLTRLRDRLSRAEPAPDPAP